MLGTMYMFAFFMFNLDFSLITLCKKFCGHHLLKNVKSIKTGENTNALLLSKKRFLTTAWKPIRIYLDYTHLDGQTDIDKSLRDGVKEVLNITVKMFEIMLYVKRSSQKLSIVECFDAQISSSVINGIDYDLILFPYFEKSYDGTIVEAAAASCAHDSVTNRPTAGVVYYNKDNFYVGINNWIEYYVYLTFHEINHILVFHDILWDLFIDSNGNTIPKNQVIGTETINGISRTVIKTPKVVEAAKRHFACDKIIGVELENQGGEGTQGNHWEMRTMLGDYHDWREL